MSYDPAHLDNTALYTESWVEVCLTKGNAHCGHSLNTWLSSKDFIADPILRVSGRRPGIKDEVSGSTHFQVELRSDEVIFLLLSLSFTSFHLASAHMWHHPRLEGGDSEASLQPFSFVYTGRPYWAPFWVWYHSRQGRWKGEEVKKPTGKILVSQGFWFA